ncbi:MAG: ABC-type transport auxiliary lipoprotein family protein [Pseudomonadota bacterium]
MRKFLLALIVPLLVVGCAGGGEKIEAIYTITASTAPPPVAGSTSAQILVPEPRALKAFSTEQIAVKPTELTLSYYPSVAYQDTAPKVLQRVLLDTFQNTGRVRAVGLPGQSLLINYQVVTEIRAFQAETFAGDRARVEVAVKLLNDANGRVIKEQVFTTTVPLPSDSAEDAAIGINQAAQALAGDIVAWVLVAL